MNKLLEGRVAIVTGAAQGIGKEYAKAVAATGAVVAAADMNEAGARETAAEICTRLGAPGCDGDGPPHP